MHPFWTVSVTLWTALLAAEPTSRPADRAAAAATSRPAAPSATANRPLAASVTPPAAAPSTAPAPPTTSPAAPSATPPLATSAPTSSGDSAVDALLDRLEARGEAIRGLSTLLEYNDIRFNPVEDKIVKRGELYFRRGEPNSQFLIVFNETIAGGTNNPTKDHYLFDGVWFTERSEKAKTIIRRQMVRPGERIDPFKLGKGPFPLPFGQRRADMLANFEISRRPPTKDDPPNTEHLHCLPRRTSELALKYLRVEMWVDRKIELPVRIEAERVSDETIIDVRFTNLNPNDAPAESRFQIDVPPGPDWDVQVEPLPDLPPGPGK